MKRLRRGELRDLTSRRHIVVYWHSGQKHFPTPSLELSSSACYCHPQLKINTNPAWNIEEFSICGEQEKWWILKWKSVWEEERGNGWFTFIVTRWPTLCKTFCISLLPRACPQIVIIWWCFPRVYIYAFRFGLLREFCHMQVVLIGLWVALLLIPVIYVSLTFFSSTKMCSRVFVGRIFSKGHPNWRTDVGSRCKNYLLLTLVFC